MKKIIPSIVLAGGILFGCSTANMVSADTGRFDFEYEGNRYKIFSQLSSDAEGGNILSAADNSWIAHDYDQNLTIDHVEGLISINKAQEIYIAGMKKVAEQDRLFESDTNRYRTWIGENAVTITSCNRGDKECRIELYATLEDKSMAFAHDNGSDGSLDYLIRGDKSLENLQPLYDSVLVKGIREGKIIKENEKYNILGK